MKRSLKRVGAIAVGIVLSFSLSAQTLKQLADQKGKKIGVAVRWQEIQLPDNAYSQKVFQEFNYAIAENNMKFEPLEPTRGNFTFSDMDVFVNRCINAGLGVRGMSYVWHQQNPTWLTNGNFSRDEMLSIMKNHIQTVMQRYKGKITEWEVANETVASHYEAGGVQLRQESPWLKAIGNDYIDWAFKYAREADPNAKLYLNEYDNAATTGTYGKSDYVYNMVKSMKERGIPIDGVGLQCHISVNIEKNLTPTELKSQMRTNIQRLADLGLEVSITELDYGLASGDRNEAGRARQAEYYKVIAELVVEMPAIKSLIIWGLRDSDSWLIDFFGHYEGLMFDDNLNAKSTYNAVRNAFAAGSSNTGSNTPYGGTPRSIPGTIQAEDFDNGGQGVAYNDNDASNNGGQYRSGDGVDIENSSEGGYNVGWSNSGEWMKYSVNVGSAGNYKVTFRVASAQSGGTLSASFSGNGASTGNMSFSGTGGWQSWTNVVSGEIALAAGQQTMQINFGGPNINLNSVSIEAAGSTSPPPPPASGDVVVRARSTDGAAQLRLNVGGSAVKTWTLTTSYADYAYTPSGTLNNVQVEFFNDAANRDVQIDYLSYNGTTLQAENQATNTGVYQNNQCGGSYAEMMHCNGYIGFGNLGSSNNGGGATHTIYDDALQNSWVAGGWGNTTSLNNANPVQTGSASVSLKLDGQWGALVFSRSAALSMSGYTALKFWAYGSSGGNQIQVVAKSTAGGTESGRKRGIAIAGTAWNEYTINLSDLGNPSTLGELWIHDDLGGAQATFYLDHIRLVGAAQTSNARVKQSEPEIVNALEEGVERFSAYPNPTTGSAFTLVTPYEKPTPAVLKFMDSNGKDRKTISLNLIRQNVINWDASWPNGLYILTIQTQFRQYHVKVMKN